MVALPEVGGESAEGGDERMRIRIVLESGLFQHSVGRMTGFDVGVHREMAFCDRAEPDFMVALSMSHKDASMLAEGS